MISFVSHALTGINTIFALHFEYIVRLPFAEYVIVHYSWRMLSSRSKCTLCYTLLSGFDVSISSPKWQHQVYGIHDDAAAAVVDDVDIAFRLLIVIYLCSSVSLALVRFCVFRQTAAAAAQTHRHLHFDVDRQRKLKQMRVATIVCNVHNVYTNENGHVN